MAESLKVFWFGYGGNSVLAEELRPIIEGLGMTLTTIHEHDNADIQWNRTTWLGHLQNAVLIIVPANWKVQPAKSNNRLTQSLSLGKPVICSPLPAYLKVAKKHPDAFIVADTQEEWKAALTKLRDDPTFRADMGEKARVAAQDYSVDVMAHKWLEQLNGLDRVDIVIPTFNNVKCLKLCLDSIRVCTEMLHNIIIVNNGPDKELHEYLDKQADIMYIKKDRMNFAQAVNVGIKAGKSKYVCILNDDVIVSKGWLTQLKEACVSDVGAIGPLSNCDKGWLHNYDINIGGVGLQPGINTYEEILPIIPQIYEYKSDHGEIIERDWVAFYATFIPRAIIDKVGYLNEEYTNSGEDVDYCRRIRKMGYRIIQNHKSFLFHFGAVSRKLLEQADPERYHKADKQTNQHLQYLWGRESVMIYSGPAWERFDFRNLEKGIGGSEIWQVCLSRELSKLGYRVTVFADCPESGIMDGDVLWLHYGQYNKWLEEHWSDYAILSRTTDPLNFPLRAGRVFVQLHDVWLMSPRDQLYLEKVEKFCTLSKWHWDFAKDYHKIPDNKMALTANGIDFSRFDGIITERDPYKLIWTSSLDRGIDNVLYLWPFIKERVPEATLHVFYGTYNWKESAKKKNDQEALKKIDIIEEGLKQQGINYQGRVSQARLALEFKSSALLLYPGWFSETFFIGGIEAQRAGVPVIANKYAGVITTLGDSAPLIGNGDAWYPYSKEGREAFLEKTIELLTNKEQWEYWSKKGFANTEKYSWEKCALRWQELFKGGA